MDDYARMYNAIVQKENDGQPITGKDKDILYKYGLLKLIQPCVLRNDYDLRLGTHETGNCIDPDSGKMVIREYKTAKTHGENVIDLPEDVCTVLKSIVHLCDKITGDKMFYDSFDTKQQTMK